MTLHSLSLSLQVLVLSLDERGRYTLSTKRLEATPGDMLRDPQLVYSRAQETAVAYLKRKEDERQRAKQGDESRAEPIALPSEA